MFSLLHRFIFLSRRICRPSLTEPLITFIELPCRFRSYSSIVPITANQSRTQRRCGFIKRPDEISQSTAEQWASMTRSCLVGSASIAPFLFSEAGPTFISPFSEWLLCFLSSRLFNHNSVRGSNQTFSIKFFRDKDAQVAEEIARKRMALEYLFLITLISVIENDAKYYRNVCL